MFKDTINPMLGNLIPKFMFGMYIIDDSPGGDGGGADWKKSIPEDIRADPVFAKYENNDDALRGLVAAQPLLGREKMPVPSGPEDKVAHDIIYKTLGRPDSEDGYTFPTDLEIPKDLPVDEGMMKNFKKTAHELGLSPTQFNGLYNFYMKGMIGQYGAMVEDQKTSAQEAENGLRTEWGAAFPQNLALARKVFDGFASEKDRQEFDKGLGNNPVLMKMFANIGKVLSEDQLTGKPAAPMLSPAEAQTQIQKIKTNMDHPYWSASKVGHKEAVEEMERLTKLTMG